MCRPQRLVLLAVVSLMAAAGCSQTAGTCLTAKDCPIDQTCVGSTCRPVSTNTRGCTIDDDCGIGEFCDVTNGECIEIQTTNCTSDDACPPHQRCQASIGLCVDGARACVDQSQCAAINYYCGPQSTCVECLNDAHCPNGSCVNNACTGGTGPECTEDAECMPPNLVCQTDRCVPGCQNAGSPVICGTGTMCNPNTGRCESGPTGCNADAECAPPSLICENNRCSPGCAEQGGLQCTGGNVCNASNGRCEPMGGCTQDSQCGPPTQVCENSQCVPGCGVPGGLTCGVGTVCDTNVGRCVPVPGRCNVDTDCNPPSQICEAGQCIGGCTEVGGLQCSGNTVCNSTTGRCDPGMMPVCMGDSDCNPPSTICDMVSGGCVAGCGTSGCPGTQICDMATGRCMMGNPNPNPGMGALNDTCTSNADCASAVCFDLGNQFGRRCVESCGASADCPTGFTCYDFNGGRMCLNTTLFAPGTTFTGGPGAACSEGSTCKSNFCPPAGNRQCVETCTESTQCGGGQCRWYEVVADRWISACNGPQGNVPDGGACTNDTDCRSGACFVSNAGPPGRCAKLCSSTASCPNGEICAYADYTACVAPLILTCLAFQPNYTKGCFPFNAGTAPVGTNCSNGDQCRSGLCLNAGTCTDVCSRNSDCPGDHRCKIVPFDNLQDGTVTYINICLPTGA